MHDHEYHPPPPPHIDIYCNVVQVASDREKTISTCLKYLPTDTVWYEEPPYVFVFVLTLLATSLSLFLYATYYSFAADYHI